MDKTSIFGPCFRKAGPALVHYYQWHIGGFSVFPGHCRPTHVWADDGSMFKLRLAEIITDDWHSAQRVYRDVDTVGESKIRESCPCEALRSNPVCFAKPRKDSSLVHIVCPTSVRSVYDSAFFDSPTVSDVKQTLDGQVMDVHIDNAACALSFQQVGNNPGADRFSNVSLPPKMPEPILKVNTKEP